MITQAELIDIVRRNIHLFQQQFQVEENLILSKQHYKQLIDSRKDQEGNKLDLWKVNNSLDYQPQNSSITPILTFQRKNIWQPNNSQNQYKTHYKMTPNSLKQHQSATRTNHLINSHHQSLNENKISDLPQRLHQQISHRRKHKIFSLPSHSPKQQSSYYQQTRTIRPNVKTNTLSLSKLSKNYKQNQYSNSNIGKVNINPSLNVNLQTHMKTVNKKLQLFSNDYLPSPSQLNAILKTIQNRSKYVPDESIQSMKKLRNKRQRVSIRYHEAINYQPTHQIQMTKKFLNSHTQVLHPGGIQISKIKFNYVDSKYSLEK